jgi:hypothetical protein
VLGLACMAVPAQPQPGPANIAAAQARRDKAFADYTRLTTTGGAGDPQQALAEYRVAVQALEALKAQAAAPPGGCDTRCTCHCHRSAGTGIRSAGRAVAAPVCGARTGRLHL